MASGVHSGGAVVKRVGSSLAAANREVQSGAGDGPFDSSSCGGTALNPMSLPCGSSTTSTMLETFMGGSLRVTCNVSDARGTKARGLERYQNPMVAGWPLAM